MPRSKVRPNVSTYHEAVNFIINAIDGGLGLPLTKKQDKFATKSLCYLAGMFGLDINAKIQEIYDHIQVRYDVPVGFITWVRVMQQETLGVSVPASYGDFEGNLARVSMFLKTLKTATITDAHTYDEVDRNCYIEAELLEEEENQDDYIDQVSNVVAESVINDKPDWDTLAAANPLAAQFVKSLISAHDLDDDDEVFDQHGAWEQPDTEGYEDDTDYAFDYTYHDED